MQHPDALVRVVRTSDGGLAVGRSLPGRGAWLCAGSPECVDRAVRSKAFGRALRASIDPALVAAIRDAIGRDVVFRSFVRE